MTSIPVFNAGPNKARDYNHTYKTLFEKGTQLEGTELDLRSHVDGVSRFQEDSVIVHTNQEKQQVLLAEKVRGDDIDVHYVPEEVESQVAEQTYRLAMKPDRFGVLHSVERVDSRNADGQVVASWMRMVETDPNSEAFSMYFPST